MALCLVAALALVGCGQKETSAPEETAAPSEQAAAPTPIDQATVATVSGKVTFQGTKPKLARIMMDQDPVCTQKHSGAVFTEDGAVNDNGT
ncbi:MAG: hypothetical protein ACRD3I_07065, partial [Terriglobales bacterium]